MTPSIGKFWSWCCLISIDFPSNSQQNAPFYCISLWLFSCWLAQSPWSFERYSMRRCIVCKRHSLQPPLFFETTTPWPSLPPFLKSLCPLCSAPPSFKVFYTVPPNLTQIPPVLVQLTSLSWFKQISKELIYQFNSLFLSKINFNLLNCFTNRFS